jgi:predicted ester cyclase
MSAEDNKELVRSFFDEVWNKGNYDFLDDAYDPNFKLNVMWENPAAGGAGEQSGTEAAKKVISGWRDSVPDLHVTVDEQVAEGDVVVSRHTSAGTHDRPMMGFPPTGKQFKMSGITFTRCAGGKMVEAWTHWDMLSLLMGIGVIPPLGQGAALATGGPGTPSEAAPAGAGPGH